MPQAQLPELDIGELLKLPPGFADRIAQVAYDPLRPIAVAHTDATEAQASQLLEALALQLLRLRGDSGAQIALYEPLPSGGFVHLKRLLARTGKAYGRQLVGDAAYHAHLQALTELAHQRFALLANLDVDTLDAYNAHPRVRRKEPWQVLVVSAVFAQSGRDGDLAALQSLCAQGPKVGILPLLLRGPAEEAEREQTHGRKPLQAFWNAVWPLCFGFDWRASPPQPVNQFDVYWRSLSRFGVAVGVPAQRVQSWVEELCAAQAQQKADAEHPDFLSVVIGDEGNEPVHFAMGAASNVFNAMLGGGVGSGKTTIVHNALLGACEALTPEQLRLWIIDPSGLEFAPYAKLPHTEFLHCALKLDDRLMRALDLFEAQWDSRAKMLGEAGVKNIDSYNAQPGRHLPRCLLVVDEAHNVMSNRRASALLSRIGREGRKFGLHMILLTPSYQELPFDNNVKGQIRLRIGCQMADEAASRNLFGHDNEAAAHIVNSPDVRMAIVNAQGGLPEANRLVHLHPLNEATCWARIAALAERYPGRPGPLEPPEAPKPPSVRPGGAGQFVPNASSGDATQFNPRSLV